MVQGLILRYKVELYVMKTPGLIFIPTPALIE